MRLSENWLRAWVNPDISSDELVEKLTMAGLEVDSVAPVAGEFTGVLVGQVVETSAHPDADKLTLCQVDIGTPDKLSMVCGATNVRPGLKVAVATIGGTLPGNFKIKKAKLRGVESFGMLCAESELGLADTSAGLMELPDDAPLGVDLRDYMSLDDNTIEVDLTPNRGDCLGVMGLAREVGVLCRAPVTRPEDQPEDHAVQAINEDVLSIRIDEPVACPRYLGRVIKGIDIAAPTPFWMTERLRRSGIRSIDPVVDVTNYVLLELGQPMHAFDLATIGHTVIVRRSEQDEKLVLLDGQEVALQKGTLVIADDEKPLAIAGVMGGAASGVGQQTRDIFLECAYFDPVSVAGKARAYGLHTDSSHRFERGVDCQIQRQAMERATALLIDIVGGEPGPVTEVVNEQTLPDIAKVLLRRVRISRILGFEIADSEIVDILSRLGMVVDEIAQGWEVTVPTYRFDIAQEIDLIEELGRIYGYNRLPTKAPVLPFLASLPAESEVGLRQLKRCLVTRDYQEAVTYSFVDETLLGKLTPDVKPMALANPISAELSVMRTTLWAGLLRAAQYNLNRQHTRVRLFESGLRFVQDESAVVQEPMLTGLVTGSALSESWNHKTHAVDFFDIKGDVESLLALGGNAAAYTFEVSQNPALHPGQSARIMKGGQYVGDVGLLHPLIKKAEGLSENVYLFELNLGVIVEGREPVAKPLSRFPEVRRDLAIIVDQAVASADVIDCARKNTGEWLGSVTLFDVYQGDNIDFEKKSLAFGLTIQHPSRTLKDEEVNDVVARVVSALGDTFGAVLRE